MDKIFKNIALWDKYEFKARSIMITRQSALCISQKLWWCLAVNFADDCTLIYFQPIRQEIELPPRQARGETSN